MDALLDPAAPVAVRRRVPPVLKSCASPIARDGLVAGLGLDSFELRRRCGRALLALTDDHPELAAAARAAALAAAERELLATDDPAFLREHVLALLTLALEREPARIAARAFETDDVHLRGTALRYFETVLSPGVFRALSSRLSTGRLSTGRVSAGPRRAPSEVRDDLLKAGATMTMSLDEIRAGWPRPLRTRHECAPDCDGRRCRPHTAGRRRSDQYLPFATPSTGMATS